MTTGTDRWCHHQEGGGRQRIGNGTTTSNPLQASFAELQRELPESDAQLKMTRIAVLKRGQHIYPQPTERLL